MFITLNSLLTMRSKNLFCIVVLLLFTINNLLGQTYEKLPYFEGFEDTLTHSSWTLNAGPNGSSATNKWYISNAESFVGENALYISADDGKSVSYKDNVVFMFTPNNSEEDFQRITRFFGKLASPNRYYHRIR